MGDYTVSYELPQEDTLLSLPLKYLKELCEKNGLKISGKKEVLVGRLVEYWNKSKLEWESDKNPIQELQQFVIESRGKVQLSLHVLSVSSDSINLCLPVFGHDYQEV